MIIYIHLLLFKSQYKYLSDRMYDSKDDLKPKWEKDLETCDLILLNHDNISKSLNPNKLAQTIHN